MWYAPINHNQVCRRFVREVHVTSLDMLVWGEVMKARTVALGQEACADLVLKVTNKVGVDVLVCGVGRVRRLASR